jgi:hypothetical protein
MSVNQNYNITQGDTFTLQVSWADSASVAINLYGYTALFEARDLPGGKFLCATASMGPIPATGSATGYSSILSGSFSSGGISTPSASSGIINLSIDSRFFNYPRTSYQLRVASPSGQKTTLVKGWLNVDAGTIE